MKKFNHLIQHHSLIYFLGLSLCLIAPSIAPLNGSDFDDPDIRTSSGITKSEIDTANSTFGTSALPLMIGVGVWIGKSASYHQAVAPQIAGLLSGMIVSGLTWSYLYSRYYHPDPKMRSFGNNLLLNAVIPHSVGFACGALITYLASH